MKGIVIQYGTDSWVISNLEQPSMIPVHPDSHDLCKSGLSVDFEVVTIATGSSEFDVHDIDVAQIQSTHNIQHGVVITKPWSAEMYAHNDRVRDVVITNLRAKLDLLYTSSTNNPEDVCYENEDFYIFAREIVGSGWNGYSYEDIYQDCSRSLMNLDGNWWLNDVYPDLVKMGYVPSVYPFFIGY